MRRWVIATVCGVLAVSTCRGGEPVKGTFKVGEERHVKMRGERERRGSKLPQATDATLKVLEAHDDHWIMEITLKTPEDPDISPAMHEAVKSQIAVFGTPMRVRITHEGEMTIINLKEVQDAALKAGALVVEQTELAAGRKVSKESLEKSQRALKDMFANPDTANSILLSNYQPWFTHLGAEANAGKPNEAEVQMQSPMGTGMIGATKTVTVTKQNESTHEFKAVIRPREQDLKRMVSQMFERFKAMAPKDEPPPDEAEMSQWKLDTTVTVEVRFDTATGWPRRVTSLKEVEIKTATESGKNRDALECVFEEVKK